MATDKKTPGIINRTPLRASRKRKATELVIEMVAKGLCKEDMFDRQVEEIVKWDDDALDSMWRIVAEQKTWRKLDEQKPKSELQVEFEQAFIASAADSEKQILADKQAAKVVALIKQETSISDLKAKRMLLVAQAQDKRKLEEELETVITDGLIEGSPPPYDNQPPVIELGSFETWDCNKVSFSKRDPVIPEHGPQAIDNPYFGLLEDEDCCSHGFGVGATGFCSSCGTDTFATKPSYTAAKQETPDEIVAKVKDRLKANNGYGQEKYQHQINVKLTDEDMKRANAIKADIFSDDVSGSHLMRIFIRQGMKKYESNQ